MKSIQLFLFWLLLFAATAGLSWPAHAQSCFDLFNKSETRPDLTTRLADETIPGITGRTFTFHNRDVKNFFSKGVNRESLVQFAEWLILQKNTLDVPFDQFGNLAAANVGGHAGGYGMHTWFRDAARTAEGLYQYVQLVQRLQNSLPAESPLQARLEDVKAHAKHNIELVYNSGLLSLVGNSQWTRSALANIQNPNLHLEPNGQHVVIWIRRFLESFQQKREPTEAEMLHEKDWGHKQNDGLAALMESVLNGLRTNTIQASAISREAKINILLLASYFMRLKVWNMWDVGAWEEGMGSRTSSISLATDFLKRFESGYYYTNEIRSQEDVFFKDLREQSPELLKDLTDADTQNIIFDSIKQESLANAVAEGTRIVESRLAAERPVESLVENLAVQRFEDTALLHIMWPLMNSLSAEARVRLIEQVNVLQRDSGYARYAQDWFLHGGAMGALHREALGLTDSLAISDGNGGWRVATAAEAALVVELHKQQEYTKDMTQIIALTGQNLDAQWTLPDSYLTRIYGELYLQTGDVKYKEMATTHFLRSSSQITGKDEFTVEGKPTAEGKIPEAYIPFMTIKPNGELEIVYAVSPNSPLNWATAEYIIALNKILEIYE